MFVPVLDKSSFFAHRPGDGRKIFNLSSIVCPQFATATAEVPRPAFARNPTESARAKKDMAVPDATSVSTVITDIRIADLAIAAR